MIVELKNSEPLESYEACLVMSRILISYFIIIDRLNACNGHVMLSGADKRINSGDSTNMQSVTT